MKSLSCRDIGGDCDFVASGETNDEVVKAMFDHASGAHPEKMTGMSEEEKQQMIEKMNSMLG